MAWTDKYIEIPFKCNGRDHSGCDCWGLVCLILREERGIILPDYSGVFLSQDPVNLRRVARLMSREKERWRRVERPKPFDGLLLRTGAYTYHVGLVVDRRRMIHVMAGTNSVVEPFDGIEWRNRVEEFRRYESKEKANNGGQSGE